LYKRLNEINGRKAEIRSQIETDNDMEDAAIALISTELENLSLEERKIMGKIELLGKAQSGQIPLNPVQERSAGGLTSAEAQMYEARSTKEYRNAFYNMLKFGKGELSIEERAALQTGNAIGNGRNIQELRFT